MNTKEWQLQLDKYQGPLDALLNLIEQKKLDITEISLAQVTSDFLEYLRGLSAAAVAVEKNNTGDSVWYTRLLADFIVIASRLVLIKSKSLLPGLPLTPEETQEIEDLEHRLKLYQELKPAMKHIKTLWEGGAPQFSRPYMLGAGSLFLQSSGGHIFYPGNNVHISAIVASLNAVFESLEKVVYEEVVVKEKIISLEEEMHSIIRRLQSLGSTHFSKLSGSRPKEEIIVLFLAILHLARDQTVLLEQESGFSDIMINPTKGH